MKDPQGSGQGTATMDRKFGVLVNFVGVFKDPQGNQIQMSLELKSTIIKGQMSNYSEPAINTITTSTGASEASQSNILITTPGFEFFLLVPTIAVGTHLLFFFQSTQVVVIFCN